MEDELEDEVLPELDPETLKFPHFYLAASSVIGFILLTVETACCKGSQLNRKYRQYLLSLLLGLLATAVTSVLILYWGEANKNFVDIIDDLLPEKGDESI